MVSSELLKKYNVPGPRYTSYPTVPYWDTTPNEKTWIETIDKCLEENQKRDIGVSIYVHIPFCHSLCSYCGCNTKLTRDRSVIRPYTDALIAELDLYLRKLGLGKSTKVLKLTELHIGGGTPTFFSPTELDFLISELLSSVILSESAELSIEADPRTTTREHLEVLCRLGFKRLSLGVQDFDPVVQNKVNRIQSEELVQQVTETAREMGIDSISYDLIYGLPLQTEGSINRTISAVKRLRPDRIAFYANAHVPWLKVHHRRFTESDLPDGETKRALYETGRSLLEQAGYREIGMDHFSLEHDRLWHAYLDGNLHRNFMGYTPKFVAPLIGLGCSAIGDSWRAFIQNEKLLESYQSSISVGKLPILRGHLLNKEDQIVRFHILNLMTKFETDWENPDVFVPFLSSASERLRSFHEDGLAEVTAVSCRVTEAGRAFLRNICMAFDARMARKAVSSPTFSKTI